MDEDFYNRKKNRDFLYWVSQKCFERWENYICGNSSHWGIRNKKLGQGKKCLLDVQRSSRGLNNKATRNLDQNRTSGSQEQKAVSSAPLDRGSSSPGDSDVRSPPPPDVRSGGITNRRLSQRAADVRSVVTRSTACLQQGTPPDFTRKTCA